MIVATPANLTIALIETASVEGSIAIVAHAMSPFESTI